jgi:peptidoglycan/xylan/chitin deacetylase (PgdA/CDA1 family)
VLALGLFAAVVGLGAHSGAQLRPIHRIETREPAVAITFDACATRTHGYGFGRDIYDVLKAEKVPATIFVSGRWVEFHPDEMKELAADPLVTFGDHSYDHPHMPKLSAARMGEEVDRTEAALARYGKKSVTWDVVSGDPSKKTTAKGMIRNVVGHARAGSIVIFHINGRGLKTADALPEILRKLREQGLRFVSLADLLALENKTP